MNRRKLSHIIAAGFLAAVLALPAPARATSGGTRGPAGSWEWLAGLLQRGISALWQKEGYGIDPNGKPSTGTGAGGAPGTATGGTGPGDGAVVLDPNG